MAIPKNVAAQAEEAEKALAAMEPQEVAVEESTSEISDLTPQNQAEEGQPALDGDLTQQLESLDKKVQVTEHQKKVQEGRMKKENETLLQQLSERDSVIAEMNDGIQALKEQLEEVKKTKAEELFSEEERDDLGNEYIGMSEKIANKIADEKTQALMGEITKLREKVDYLERGSVSTTHEVWLDRLLERLNVSEDQLKQVDESSQFEDFLTSPDGYSGRTLGESLSNAVHELNLDVTVGIYSDFLAKLGHKTKRAVMPDRQSAAYNGPEAAGSPLQGLSSYDAIAQAYSSGRIDEEQMGRAMEALDAQTTREMVSGRLDLT